MGPAPAGEIDPPRATVLLIGLAGLVLIGILLALGTWQIQRRAWKLDLIARVDARIHAPPVAPPGPDQWPGITRAGDEYRHVVVTGTWLPDRATFTQAVTDYGPGYWLLMPLRTTAGDIVLVNRGFVPPDRRDSVVEDVGQAAGPTTVVGLLRLSEPGGGFLRSNDPAQNRWYSRDVAAIATARGLGPVAPYFIDADGPPDPSRLPVGGLTVVRFPNNHLVYALTWYSLAILLTGALVWVIRDARRRSPGRL